MYKAVCIGINEYPWGPLNYACADAKELASCLQQSTPAYDVVMLLDKGATRSSILNAIEALAKSPEETKFLYLAGHGTVRETGAYFIPHGALDTADMVSFSDIRERLSPALNKKSGFVCLVLDCCNAGAFSASHPYSIENFRTAVNREIPRTNVVSLLACTIGTSARERPDLGHGVFTYYLCRGLMGAAAVDDGSVTADQLFGYISRNMEAEGDQRPVLRAEIAGRAIVVPRAPNIPKEVQRKIAATADVATLQAMLNSAEVHIAEQKPPFVTRGVYREKGWLASSKVVLALAEKRSSLEQRYGDFLSDNSEWQFLSADVDTLLSEFATGLGVGTKTEFGVVVSKIGEGGFGTVYKVESGNEVRALKVLLPTETTNKAKVTRFKNGYRAMNMLSHPRVVRVQKFVECPMAFFMDFIDGPNLRRWLTTSLDAIDRVSLLLDVVTVVEYAHSTGVLHRDIKPENVIMRYNMQAEVWEPILTDFDLAWFVGLTKTTKTGDGFGAPFYAAPEQLLSPNLDVAHESSVDVYSLAMLSLFVLTGEDPMHVEASLEKLQRVLRNWPSAMAATTIVDVLKSASERQVDKRVKSVSVIRKAFMNAKSALYSGSDPDQVIEVKDFWAVAGAALNRRVAVDGSASVSCESQSGRTLVRVELERGSVRGVVTMSKQGPWLAEKSAISSAKEALVRRVDAVIHHWGKEHQNLIARRRGGKLRAGDGAAHIEVDLRALSSRNARAIADLVAELIVVYEAF